jgi:glycerate kinase
LRRPQTSRAQKNALQEAALHYTGERNITASFFADKAEEGRAFEALETALNHYREALETAKMSEMAKILRLGQ